MADVSERQRTEREYFDSFIERKWAELKGMKVDERLIPRAMGGRFVEILKTHFLAMPDLSKVRVLDCGCGFGVLSILLAKKGIRVDAVDLSPRMVELARELAGTNGVSDLATFHVAPIEAIPFEDAAFDAAVGTRILHHADIGKAGSEIARVVKDGAKAFFWECTYKSWALNAIRRIARAIPGFPVAGTPYEHPLTREEIALLASRFPGGLDLYSAPFAFFSHLSMVATKGEGKRAMEIGEAADRAIERAFPFLSRSSFHQIIELKK